MNLFFQFVLVKWYLFAALMSVASLLIWHERRKTGAALSPAEMVGLVNHQDAVILDVRDVAEFRKGHIVDSINMPHTKLKERIGELEKYKSRPLIVVCNMGQHSGAVARTLKESGYETVYRLAGGILEWQSSQLPLLRS